MIIFPRVRRKSIRYDFLRNYCKGNDEPTDDRESSAVFRRRFVLHFQKGNHTMSIHQFTKTGTYHKRIQTENQDCVRFCEGEAFRAIMLADGASSASMMARESAVLACEAAAQIIDTEGIDFFRSRPDRIAYLLSEHILYRLERALASGQSLSDYGSTFAMAFTEKADGRTVLINLGDGAVMSAGKESPRLLMPPVKHRGKTCLTTTEGVCKAVNVTLTQTKPGEHIILCSDGFLSVLVRGGLSAAICLFDPRELNRLLLLAEPEDDCSYISMQDERKEEPPWINRAAVF